jgi:HEAT repeat protein
MSFLKQIFVGKSEPSEKQIARGIKQVTQQHGEAATRVAAMERLAEWKTPEAAAALLRRFTIQVPQASMDHEEKQYAVRLLVQMERVAVEPILQYLRSESEVTWPVRALRELLPPAEYALALLNILNQLAGQYSRWPEAKKVLLEHIPDDSFPQVKETIVRFLEDEDDDVCIAAVDYLARNGDEGVREQLLETFLSAESRPRVRGRILNHFVDREWPVKGFRKKVEDALQMPFYLTAKGTVKRREL